MFNRGWVRIFATVLHLLSWNCSNTNTGTVWKRSGRRIASWLFLWFWQEALLVHTQSVKHLLRMLQSVVKSKRWHWNKRLLEGNKRWQEDCSYIYIYLLSSFLRMLLWLHILYLLVLWSTRSSLMLMLPLFSLIEHVIPSIHEFYSTDGSNQIVEVLGPALLWAAFHPELKPLMSSQVYERIKRAFAAAVVHGAHPVMTMTTTQWKGSLYTSTMMRTKFVFKNLMRLPLAGGVPPQQGGGIGPTGS